MLYGSLPEQKLENGDVVRGITVRVPNPPKSAIVRLPTSDEMIARLDAQKSIRRSLGRRKSQTEPVPNPKADLALFAAIKVAGDDFDEFESKNAVSKLTVADVVDCEREGNQYKITLKTPFGESTHALGIPTAKQLHAYRNGIVNATELPHNQDEIRYRAQVAVDLYDATVAASTGYVEGVDVPAHHKFAVAAELVQAIDDIDPVLDPNS